MLLWRGSCHRFGAKDFHSRCDGHARTLTFILNKDGHVLGSFTPVKWESRVTNCFTADEDLVSFIFTSKNPHGIIPRRFELRQKKKDSAIWCDASWGLTFGGGDIEVSDNCSTTTPMSSANRFGRVETNDAGVNGKIFLTGAEDFTVKEIEVFTVTTRGSPAFGVKR